MSVQSSHVSDEDLKPPKLIIQDLEKLSKIENELSCLIFTVDTCKRIRSIFRDELNKGLRSDPSSLQMANTYLSELPDGKEEGTYLALDLGGTNFRVLVAEFKSGQMSDVQARHYDIPESLRLGPGQELFDYLADCVSDFLARKQLKGRSMPLGFTFSFPMVQRSLRSGILVKWTKTFNCSDVEGRDVVKLLNEALCRRGVSNVSTHAILNDTTGTLMMGAYMDRNTSVGLILGTGCNACYFEKSERVKSWKTKGHGKEVVIDIEWGAFGDNGVLDFIQTDFDVQVDANSLLVKSFTFEKYISGNYLGEIVRVILVGLIKNGLLFGGHLPNSLSQRCSFSSATISRIEECTLNDSRDEILHAIDSFRVGNKCTEDDLRIIQHVCSIVSNRSALLVSLCLSELIDLIDRPEVTIAVDGSLYQKHPRYQNLMDKYIKLFTRKKFKVMEVFDGSGRGAALVTAIALKMEEKFGAS